MAKSRHSLTSMAEVRSPRPLSAGPLWPALLGLALLLPSGVHAQANVVACGAVSAQASDYRTPTSYTKAVESAHFTPGVESLVRGSTGSVAQDLGFVLDAIPNHHRALAAVMRLGERMKSPQPSGLRYSVACYFDRALRFRPDDVIARLLYANFLARQNRASEAAVQLQLASTAAGDDPFTHYNIGLIYFDLKLYDEALTHAHKAIEYGFPQTALRDELKAAGHWKDPPPAKTTSAPSAAASGASRAPSSPATERRR